MLRVLFLQLPVPNNPGANIPLAAGYLKAYAHAQGLLEHVEWTIMPRAVADHAGDALLVDTICAHAPDVLALSLYTWNSERSLLIAALAKQRRPELIVVVGGPEVQRNNQWVLEHPAVDIAVEGEGEQTFCAVLRQLLHIAATPAAACRWCQPTPETLHTLDQGLPLLTALPGTVHRHADQLVWGPARPALESLSAIPSPYLLGYLELRPGEMALIECSRWCPYGCTFCLYGRSMGSKLGSRLFSSERILAEVQWARAHGAGAIHFVEANLNLLPIFRELMQGLQQINTPDPTPLYAELRGEHLKEETVTALVAAGLDTAEVGLQSANPAILLQVGRRTDLEKWAAGTRRLYAHGVNVLLDVILGLPGEDRAATLHTIDWIKAQELGPYDIFTLQVLPGTGVRSDAARFGLRYQTKPPYYVLATDQLSYSELRGLRWELREAAGLDPLAVEGLPQPQPADWNSPAPAPLASAGTPIAHIAIDCAAPLALGQWQAHGAQLAQHVASHVVLKATHADLAVIEALCWPIAAANPSLHWDVIIDDPTVPAAALRELGARWPHTIGYLDRIAVYRRLTPSPDWYKITPRWWVVASWGSQHDPLAYEGVADWVWRVPSALWAQAWPELQRAPGLSIIIDGPISAEQRAQCHAADVFILNDQGEAVSIPQP